MKEVIKDWATTLSKTLFIRVKAFQVSCFRPWKSTPRLSVHHYSCPVPERRMRHLFEGPTTCCFSQMPEMEETYIITCGKKQELVGFSCTHSFPTTLLPDCKLQSSQPCSPSLLCHPQRPALSFHLVEQWQKSILQRRELFPEESGFTWVKNPWGAGRRQWGWKGVIQGESLTMECD